MDAQQTSRATARDPRPGPGPVTAFVQPLGIGLVVVLAFLLVFLTALHDPRPHQLPVAVVAPTDVVAGLQHSISSTAVDAVALRPAENALEARHQLERGEIVAAYLPSQGEADGLLVAGAQGAAVTQAVTGIFTRAAQSHGARLQVDDVVPLTTEDPRGGSTFFVIFGIVLAGFVFGQTSHLYSRRLSVGSRLIQALGFSVLVGLAGALIAGPLLGVLPGPFLPLAGILVLLALVAALVTMACTQLLGDRGVIVVLLLLVILGNATSGGAVSTYLLPDGFRQLSPALPTGAATQALSRVNYFDSVSALEPVAVLVAWALGALLVLLLPAAVTGRRRRARPVTALHEQAAVTPSP